MLSPYHILSYQETKPGGTISDTDFQAVTPDARSKDHFVLVDAVGGCERLKTDEPSLERKRSVPFDKLLTAVALGTRDEDTLLSLAGRLGRLGRKMSAVDEQTVMQYADGMGILALSKALMAACDPDHHLESARHATGQQEPEEQAIQKAAQLLMAEVVAPYDNADLRTLLITMHKRNEQLIDPVSQDRMVGAGWDAHAEERPVKRPRASGSSCGVSNLRDQRQRVTEIPADPSCWKPPGFLGPKGSD